MRSRISVTPLQFRRVSYIALGALTLIVLTGAAVRLTDSGLGCSNWPKCGGTPLPPLSYHALVEFGNRVVSGIVGVVTVVVFALSFFRRPYRRDLMWLSLLLPLGVVAQAVLGGFTVLNHLAPGFVMAHFSLSLIILVAALSLAWRSTFEAGSRPRSTDYVGVWSVRALLLLGALTIFAGTATTAAGPHSGGFTGQVVHRLHFKGADTLNWVVHRHATIAALFGVAVIGVWLLERRRGSERTLEPLTVLGDPARGPGSRGQRAVRTTPSFRHGLGPRCPGHRHVARPAVGGSRRRRPCAAPRSRSGGREAAPGP